MKILHYFLGFPPYRTGGLTKYSFDLMTSQAKGGDQVFALWPGKMNGKKTAVSKGKQIAGVTGFELINPLPVALDEGVRDFDAFTKPCDAAVYVDFLKHLQPDVIHIHTLMGLHKEFIDAAQHLGIRTVFTSHDYYGICPKVTLYRNGQPCDGSNCKNCIACNQTALSLKKITLMQSPLYRFLKNSPIVKFLRKRHRSAFFGEETVSEIAMEEAEAEKLADGYGALRNYYLDMLSRVDMIHFNSRLTESVYTRCFTPKASRVIPITHRDIRDMRDLPHKDAPVLRITCLAPAKPFKGYAVMKEALDRLWATGKRDFVLNMYGPVPEVAPYMQVQEAGFDHSQLPEIMAQTDVLLAVSVWYETFGFTVLEALSFGVPVIVSDHVGAADIVGNGGRIIPASSADALAEAITALTPEALSEMREAIKKELTIKTWDAFLRENKTLYEEK